MATRPDPAQRIFVVDDDEAMRDSLIWLLESHGYQVQALPSAEAFLQTPAEERHGCLILDVRMPGMSGLELHDRLLAEGCLLPVIFITGHGDVPMAVSALKKGAADFIEKPFAEEEMLSLVERCLKTEQVRRSTEDHRERVKVRLTTLTPREREVMDLVVQGKLNKQIADALAISFKTVEVHRARVMSKMEVGSVAELVRDALSAKESGT